MLAERFLVASSTLRVCRVEFRVLANSLVALTHTPIAVHPHLQDRRTVQRVCAIVAKRAARLAAMAIAAVVAQMDSDVARPTAAVDGSVFAKYPRFKEVTQATKAMLLHFFVALTGVGVHVCNVLCLAHWCSGCKRHWQSWAAMPAQRLRKMAQALELPSLLSLPGTLRRRHTSKSH